MRAVIIPAYEPDEGLLTIVNQLWEAEITMIVVDDGSGMEYDSIFEAISDVAILLHHPQNAGKGAAIKTALDYIQKEMWDCTVVGIMDADGQHLTEDMIKLLQAAEVSENTLVLGVREVGKKMPVRSRIGNQITRAVFQAFTGTAVSDTQTGLRAFSASLIPQMMEVEGQRYEYEMNVLVMCVKERVPIRQVEIHTLYRDRANTTSHFRPLADSFRIYQNLIKFSLSSLSSFVLDYLLFGLLMGILPHTAVPILCANVGARLVSAVYNYGMNCRFVFRTEKRFGTAVSYIGLAAAILVMNNVILEVLSQGLHLSVYPAKLLTEMLLFLISWLVQRNMIFKKAALSLENKGGRGYEKVILADKL